MRSDNPNNVIQLRNHCFCVSAAILATLLLTACNRGWLTTVGPDYSRPHLPVADSWQSTQPKTENHIAHQGLQTDLLNWWQRFQDPTLSLFLHAAEKQSYSVASALARIEQARAGLVGADSAFMPSVDSTVGYSRSSFSIGGPAYLRQQYDVGLQSNWELDLFGGLARQQQAAISQLESREAAWHDARVAVAIEVANSYLNYRYCQIQVRQLSADVESRQTTMKLSNIAVEHGFRADTDLVAAQATVAEGHNHLLQQQGQCQRAIKGLVELTGLAEPMLNQALDSDPKRIAKLPSAPAFKLDSIPARVLSQRPDIAAAERSVAEASANIGVEKAKRFPKLSLSGNITPTLQSVNAGALMLAQTWSFGPTLNLPLFDAGKRAANVDSAIAQYQAAVSNYASKVRTAVKEVEEALVRLDFVAKRLPEAHKAEHSYARFYQASRQLFASGLGNLLDLETARRNRLSAESSVLELEHEQISAWIALYRAAGGSWQATESTTYPSPKTQPSPLLKEHPPEQKS